MPGYSADDSMVRVDFFKESGKWYMTEAVKFIDYARDDIQAAFRDSLREHFKDNPSRLKGMTAVCLEPYHKWAHPLMIKDW